MGGVIVTYRRRSRPLDPAACWDVANRIEPGSRGPAQPRAAGSPHHRPIRWYETQLAAMLDDLPAALVDLAVMVVAEQDQVAELGLAATRPELDVVRLRPAGRPLAARPPTASVAQSQRATCGSADHTRRPADINHDRVRHHDTRDG